MDKNEAFFIMVDEILRTAPMHNQFNLSMNISGNLLVGKRDGLSEKVNADLDEILKYNTGDIYQWLLDEGYFKIENHSIGYVIMTEKGKEARKAGGHKKYLKQISDQENREKESEIKKDKEQKKLNWPQKNWWVVMILTAFVSGAVTKYILPEPQLQTTQPQQVTPTLKDTVYIFRIDTVYRIDTAGKTLSLKPPTSKKGKK